MKYQIWMSLVLSLLVTIEYAHCQTFILNPKDSPLSVVSENFLSVALDTSNIVTRFSNFNLSDTYVTKLVSHLSPMYFRVGGTFADKTGFSEDENSPSGAEINFLASDWLKVYRFTQNAGVDLIYDLNSLMRNAGGSWNSTNAERMIKFSNDRNMKVTWELGNEPDLYNSIYKTRVDPTQLAVDYHTLRGILNKYSNYKSAHLVGNDMFDVGGNEGNQNYLSTFLKNAADAVYAVTFHHYYFASKDATEELFLSPSTFNYLEQRINVVKNIVGNSGKDNKIWLGETSSAYGGGRANMSNRYISTFLWLDKLGLGAKLGLDVIIRQTIYQDNYALIDMGYKPNPDWWVSVLYKLLVGNKVLNLANNDASANSVRLYAHCAKKNSLWSTPAVVVFGFNSANQNASITLNGLASSDTVYSYELTSESSLYSQNVRLNGAILSISSDGNLPDMKPCLLQGFKRNRNFSLPPYSLVFWVFSNSGVQACN